MGAHAQVRAITPSREVSNKGLCEGAGGRIGLQNKESVATGHLQTQCLQLHEAILDAIAFSGGK